MPARTRADQGNRPAEESLPKRRGRKPVADKEAPHGRDEKGQPLAPYGFLGNGKPRIHPQREVSNLDVAMLASPAEVPAEVAEATKPARPRSEQQQAVDGAVRDLYEKWVKAGKPSDWAELPKGRYHVSPDVAGNVRFLLNKAAELHKVRVRFGSPVRDTQGREVIVYAVMDKTARKSES